MWHTFKATSGVWKVAPVKLIEYVVLNRRMQTHTCWFHDSVNWRERAREVTDRKRDGAVVEEEHLWHDLSSFTCCLSHILKARKAAVWTLRSLLRPRALSGQREGEQLAKSQVTHHFRKTSCLYPVALASLLLQQCDFWLCHMKDKTSHDTSCLARLWHCLSSCSHTWAFTKTHTGGEVM